LFKLRVRPAATPPADEPVKGSKVNPDPKVKVEGPYKEYGVDMVPDKNSIKDLSCPPSGPDGNRICRLEVATYVYDKTGQLIVASSARTSARLTPANYATMLQRGMAFHQEISVPVKGEYYLRTAIHDMDSDRVGAVEVPVAAVAHLQPLEPLPVASAPVKVPTTSTDAPAGAGSSFPAATPGGVAPAVASPVPAAGAAPAGTTAAPAANAPN
jgi:hypothetical protein